MSAAGDDTEPGRRRMHRDMMSGLGKLLDYPPVYAADIPMRDAKHNVAKMREMYFILPHEHLARSIKPGTASEWQCTPDQFRYLETLKGWVARVGSSLRPDWVGSLGRLRSVPHPGLAVHHVV